MGSTLRLGSRHFASLAVSVCRTACESIRRINLDIAFEDIGEQQLKNIARPVRVYRARLDDAPARPALALPDKPSIAVLAFENMSGDPEQEYFADGIADDIITELSRFSDLFVIARNSSFRYKGKAVDLRQVGRELGVRYGLFWRAAFVGAAIGSASMRS